MKWNVHQIENFLSIYERFPILWSTKHHDHTDMKLKNVHFKQMWSELENQELIGDMDERQLRNRIKSIKDVYRQELNKIERYKKSKSRTEQTYVPKLSWFKAAHFLGEVVSTGSRKSTLQVQPEEASVCWVASNINSLSEDALSECSKNKCSLKFPSKRKDNTPKKPKKIRESEGQSEITDSMSSRLSQTAENTMDDKPFDIFGKYVANELRQLPPRKAILLQQEMLNSIIKYKLSCLEPEDVVSPYVHQLSDASIESRSICSNNFEQEEDAASETIVIEQNSPNDT